MYSSNHEKVKKEREKNLQPCSQGSLLPALRSIGWVGENPGNKVEESVKFAERFRWCRYWNPVPLLPILPILRNKGNAHSGNEIALPWRLKWKNVKAVCYELIQFQTSKFKLFNSLFLSVYLKQKN